MAKDLLDKVEVVLELAVEQVPSSYQDLGGGSAVLQREQGFIYVDRAIEAWGPDFCALIAHEIGHYFLDASKPPTTVAHLSSLLDKEECPGAVRVEAYGVRERQELQANVFARELLLPRDVARLLASQGKGPKEISRELGIPLEFCRLQALDALLLPEYEGVTSVLQEASPDQHAAATAKGKAANVIAGPGTGKTTTLIHRIKHLIESEGVNPSQILALTFTNKAAHELIDRLQSAGIRNAGEIWSGTFHSLGLEFLRKYHQRFGLDSDLRVADLLSTITMMVGGLPRVRLNYYSRVEDPYVWLEKVLEAIARLKEELITPSAYRYFVVESPSQDAEVQAKRADVATLFELYEDLLAERREVDFVDLISKPALAIRADRLAFKEFADNFTHVLVDEYQDVTQVMVEFTRQLAFKKSIWVVGDIRQAIHHWRGASLKSILKFEAEFKAHSGDDRIQRYPLTSNRRSYQEIVDLTQHVGRSHVLESQIPLDAVSSFKGLSHEKPVVVTCSSKSEILGAVLQNIKELAVRGVSFGGQAVLCRSTADLQSAAEGLAAHGIPVVYVGDVSRRPEIKRLLCLMQVLVERRPKALLGLHGTQSMSMSLSDVLVLTKAASADIKFQRGGWLGKTVPGLSQLGASAVASLARLLEGYRRDSNPWDFVCDMILEHRISLPPAGDTSVQAWNQRIALWQFAYSVRNSTGDMKEARLSRFLMRHRLRQRIGENSGQRELPPEAGGLDGVRLLTVHGSKGLEFEAVHVAYVRADSYGAKKPGWAPENILDIVPPEVLGSSIDEYESEAAVERNNLLYVAVSRAKRHLYLYQDKQFGDDSIAPQLVHYPYKFNPVSYNGPSLELPGLKAAGAFVAPKRMTFSDFDKYVTCALKYWYSCELGLIGEADIDVSARARSVVMESLKEYADGTASSAGQSFARNWADRGLPNEVEDPSLWTDALSALHKGESLVRDFKMKGGVFFEPTSTVDWLTIEMPWGFRVSRSTGIDYSIVKFMRRRVADISTNMKPLVSLLDVEGHRKVNLSYVMSSKIDEVRGAVRIESTKSYKAIGRMRIGDNSPSVGYHCRTCDFSTICPSAPLLVH